MERADAQGFTVGAGLSLSGDTGYLSGNPGPQSDLRKCPARVTVAMFPLNLVLLLASGRGAEAV